ncbi:ArsR/SmtB family transcription factor [Streptomyces sp. NPDC005576]|uniref:ArsR/SmtB family transcription factor n=1 Tax=unclassified Streptomyces TaxID=2593676 RepID=UPI0033C9CFF9
MSTAASTGRAIVHPPREAIRLEAVLRALSDLHRLAVVRALAVDDGERACTDFDLPVSKSTLTHHFRVLREAGLIHQTYRGSARLNRLRTDDLSLLFPGLIPQILRAADRHHLPGADPVTP